MSIKKRVDYGEKYRAIGQRIAYYRRLRGLSRESLAEKLQCSLSDIRRVEGDCSAKQGGTWPRSLKNLAFLCEVAEVLEVGLSVFFLPLSREVFEQYRTDK